MSDRRIIDIVLSFIKAAPKSGRTYTEMLKHVCNKVYCCDYNRATDRGLIAHCFETVQESCIKKDGRYFYCA